jgi:C4-dicarboxylate transporter DctM subunit
VAGTLALLMPLSIPFLVYAFVSGVSMRTLSMAGLVPALLSALALIAVCMWHGKSTACDNGDERASIKQICRAMLSAGPALIMPVFIIGGIWSGYFTPTEAAAVAVVYGLAVSMLLYKDLPVGPHPRLAAQGLHDQCDGYAGDRRHRRSGLADHRRAGVPSNWPTGSVR